MSDNDATGVTRDVVQRGLWFGEYKVGARYLYRPGRTVTGTDGVLLMTLTMNTQSLHLDAHWSSQQPGFGGERLVNSMWMLSTVVRLSVGQLTLGTIVASLGLTEAALPASMLRGDTLYAETVCRNKRLSRSRPNQGIVELEHIGRNQDGTVVCYAVRSTLVQCAPTSLGDGSENVTSAGKRAAHVYT